MERISCLRSDFFGRATLEGGLDGGRGNGKVGPVDTKKFGADEVIFREGDESREAYRIASGSVEIAIRTPYGPRAVAQLHAGEIFGEMGLVDDRPRSATAKTLERTALEVITEENFEEEILGNRDLANDYIATLFERLRTTDNLLQMALKRQPASGTEATDDQPHSMENALVQHIEVGESESPEGEEALSWKVTLRSVFEKSGWKGEPIHVAIDKFPFRIGRKEPKGEASSPFGTNDLLIPDGVPYQISRNHCVIERHGNRFILLDRGSTLGTVVNDVPVGVQSKEIAAGLEPGENSIVLGAAGGPYTFVLTIEEG